VDIAERLRAALAGRYELDRELGHGGMAMVYLARDVRHQRRVAVKVMRPELAATLAADRFLREIHIAAELQHPLIVPLYDSGGGPDGLLWYVMPYVEGETLRTRLLREKQLPIEEALAIARDAAEALTWAHAHGIVHRDIKPENILLSGEHAMVADFGLARAVTQAAGGFTSSGLVVGTPQYMSPEQGSGNATVDARSDIYSLGCVLYEMLAGEPPFTGPTPQAVIAKQVSERVPSLRVVRPAVPEGTAVALERALAKTPADRFATPHEFITALAARSPARSGRWRRARVLLPAAVVVTLGWLGWRALSGASLDANRYLVASFERGPGAVSALLDADQCQWRLSAALRSWDGISVADNFQVHDALARRALAAPTQRDWLALARGLGIGRLVRGEVARVGDTTFVTASVFDVASGDRPIQQVTEPVTEQTADLPRRFGQIAARLLGLGPPATAAWGTRSLAAGRAFVAGDNALANGRLAVAADSFLEATRRDPQFADAYFWLAESQAWRGEPPAVWDVAARRAADLRSSMADVRARRLVSAVGALAEEHYPEACDRFRAVVARDPTDFAAWIGLGECQFRDGAVVRDSASPSGMRFRSSYASAARAYRRALELAPWLTGAFLPRLTERLLVDPNQVVRGYGLPPDTGMYWAHPALVNDTLAFVPYPVGEVRAAQPWTEPATLDEALARDRETLRGLAESWASAYPTSPDAAAAAAQAAEQLARVSHDDAMISAALERVSHALGLAPRDSLAALRLAHTRVRLLLKLGRFAEARAAAESLLASHRDPDSAVADTLAPLAVLVGQAQTAARLSALNARLLAAGEFAGFPLPLLEVRERLRAYAAVGGPADSLRALTARADSGLRLAALGRGLAAGRDRLLGDAAALAFPMIGPGPMHGKAGPNYLLQMQAQLARGDSAGVRARLTAAQAVRTGVRPQDIAVALTFQEAWLWLQVGDSAAAERRLNLALNPLSGLGVYMLSDVAEAGTLVRSMALVAELAERRGHGPTARRWAAAVADLWRDADPELQPTVQRMRAIARGGGR
jgi:tetratricopeptide (TPR) repeat protein/tRNA A-37 threonylcarbamoyl transferase component Bud32